MKAPSCTVQATHMSDAASRLPWSAGCFLSAANFLNQFPSPIRMKTKSLLLGLALCAAFRFCGAAPNNEFGIDVRRLSPRAAMFYGDPWNNAILALATSQGLVVMDSSWSGTVASGFREAIQTEFKRSDFACLINTHEHTDHIGGNEAFAGLPIVGHESVRQMMLQAMADPAVKAKWRGFSAEQEIAKLRDHYGKIAPKFLDSPAYAGLVKCYRAMEADFHGSHVLVPPTITFDRRMTLHMGDLTIRLRYFGGFHSVGDTIISIPEENLVMIGQLFFSRGVPVASQRLAESTTPQMVDNWFVVLREVLAETDENTRFLTCSQRQIMGQAECQRFYAYLEQLWNGVRRAKAGGKTFEQCCAALPLQDFSEMAKQPNESLRGTEWEILDVHRQNIGFFWKVLEK